MPESVRAALAEDYAQVERMLEKIEQGRIHVAVFGRVSVGKSAMVNALVGERRFTTSPLHGETKYSQSASWREYHKGNVDIIDTPGIDEVDGAAREALAREVAGRSDLVLFVIDGDITAVELRALKDLVQQQRPLLLVLNKIDRYTTAQRAELLESLRGHTADVVDPRNIVTAAADPGVRYVILVDADGNETEVTRQSDPDVGTVKERLWAILEAEGKNLVALNAALFAGQLSDRVTERMMAARRDIANRVVRSYSVTKGVTVSLMPVGGADLLAAAAVDVSMVVTLSQIYGLPLSKTQATNLIRTIGMQMIAIWGAEWTVHLISSAIKLGTGGLSSAITGLAQGTVAYFGSFVVGQAAERYLAHGMSWGEGGPKTVVREILAGLDRESIMVQARAEILARLRV